MTRSRRKICFVTGSRAEFGLMSTTLGAIKAHPGLRLQIVATGMHLDRSHGDGLASIRAAGWRIDDVVPWSANSGKSLTKYAAHTGSAMAGLAGSLQKLRTDIVLVVGDRVEAFAAAAAGHLSGRIVAHVHGGDRAAGQADDCLRHAISKLAHVHFPATKRSADRLIKMGEDRWRIHRCGSPGVDGIVQAAASWNELTREFPSLISRQFALVVHHPVDSDEALEATRMRELIAAVGGSEVSHIVVIHPNNDPGSRGISRVLDALDDDQRRMIRRDVPRSPFLALMRDAAVMIGNSSSGIIEAASFGTPVIDVGPRQDGREHGLNVFHAQYGCKHIAAALSKLWDGKGFVRIKSPNVYGAGRGASGAGEKIAAALAKLKFDPELRRKLIAY
jgi:UDP-hydrolysing UDP-N-acetyl-D-glucosamine 2-epimerase